MARLMRAIRSGAAGAAILFWTGAAIATPVAQDAQDAQQVSSDDRESPADYDWIDRADALWDAIGDAPPDYSFAYDDGTSRGEPWAWETADGYWIVVEDTPQGMRSYYFAPDAAGPFLAREAENSFGYDDGEVAMVYDAGGGALPRAQGAAYIDEGEALYDRGVRLLRALRQRNWQPVNTTAWIDLSFVLVGLRHQWDEGRLRHPGWRRHRELPRVIAEHRRWDSEQRRRADAAERFRRWRASGFQGQPPGRPGGWVQGPHRPQRPDGQAGRPGRWTPATGPQAGPAIARPVPPPRRAPGPRIPPGKMMNAPVENDTVEPTATAAAPTPPPATARPDRNNWRAGGSRPWRDRGEGARPAPVAPAAPVAVAPAPQPATPTRPIFRPRPSADGAPGRGQEMPRATRPAFVPRERPAAPAAGAAVPQRPAYTPPPQRPAAAPAPRPAAPRPAPPPRPAKIDRGDSGKVD